MERDFPHPSRPALGPTQPPIHWVRISVSGLKRPGRGVNHPPPSSAEVKERVELHLYSPSGPSWAVPRVSFTFSSSVEISTLNVCIHVSNYTASRSTKPNPQFIDGCYSGSKITPRGPISVLQIYWSRERNVLSVIFSYEPSSIARDSTLTHLFCVVCVTVSYEIGSGWCLN